MDILRDPMWQGIGAMTSLLALLLAVYSGRAKPARKNKRSPVVPLLYAVFFCGMLLAGGGVITRSAVPVTKNMPPDSAVIVEESLVRVPANKIWHDTGIMVRKADWLEFAAKGSWWNGISLTGPDGDAGWIFGLRRPASGRCPVPDGNLGELIGNLDNGSPFRIGSSAARQVDRDGILMLAMNDNAAPGEGRPARSCYDDNNGTVEVRVTVRRVK